MSGVGESAQRHLTWRSDLHADYSAATASPEAVLREDALEQLAQRRARVVPDRVRVAVLRLRRRQNVALVGRLAATGSHIARALAWHGPPCEEAPHTSHAPLPPPAQHTSPSFELYDQRS